MILTENRFPKRAYIYIHFYDASYYQEFLVVMKPVSCFIYGSLLLLLFSHCNRLAGNSFVPALPGYSSDENRILLKRPLREISGIDYISDHKLVAINDEAGKLFFIDPSTGNFEEASFGDNDDYEDVVKAGQFYYVLNSKGNLFEISVNENKLVATYKHDFGKFTEFESLCYDKEKNQLLLICKECGKHPNHFNAYRFLLSSKQFVDDDYFSISWADIRQMAKDNSIECKPSAAAINPVSGKLYIISSIGKILLQCSNTGTLEAVFKLNPDYFPQPEGMTFTPEGDLYISNEGGQGKATLLRYVYKH